MLQLKSLGSEDIMFSVKASLHFRAVAAIWKTDKVNLSQNAFVKSRKLF